MTKWIMSANRKYFDHEKAFAENGFIDWKQTRNYDIGDVVYIYVTKPDSEIEYVAVVEAVNLVQDQIVDQKDFWRGKKQIYKKEPKYCRLRLLRKLECDGLTMERLKEHGMMYPPQSPYKVKEELAAYINTCIGEDND